MSNFYLDVIRKDSRYSSTSTIKDMGLLEPGTRGAVLAIIADAAALGHKLVVTETYRSQARQTKVFLAGASKLRMVGCHGYGIAADLGLYVNGKYDGNGQHYGFLVDLCTKHGMVSGIDWGQPGVKHTLFDAGHIQRIQVADQPKLFAGTFYPAPDYNPWAKSAPVVPVAAASAVPASVPTIRRGDHGPSVTAWQQALRRAGFTVSIDGDFGAMTETVTKALQRAHGLTTDGVVGPGTWAVMK